jgi:fumarate reductase subunit C
MECRNKKIPEINEGNEFWYNYFTQNRFLIKILINVQAFKTFLYNYSIHKKQNPKVVKVKTTNSNIQQESATTSP